MRIISNQRYNHGAHETYTKNKIEDLWAKAPNLKNKILTLYPKYTLQALLQGNGEVWGTKKSVKDQYDNFYEWKIAGPEIRKAIVVEDVAGASVGAGFTEFTVCVDRDLFIKGNQIKLKNHQVMRATSNAVKINSKKYQYTFQILGNDEEESIDGSYLVIGEELTQFSDAQPEAHYEGGISGQENWENHREYLTTIRKEFDITGDANLVMLEDEVISDGQKKKQYYAMEKFKLNAIRDLMHDKENQLIWGKSTVNPSTGETKLFDSGNKQRIITGNGIYHQMHSSNKMTYSTLTKNLLQEILIDMKNKSNGDYLKVIALTGTQGFADANRLLEDMMKPGDNVFSLRSGKEITVGANYRTYLFANSEITFVESEVFNNPNMASDKDSYGRSIYQSTFLMLDMSSQDGEDNIQLFTQPGQELITNTIAGVGGLDGKSSGEVASSVNASKYIITSKIGVALRNPYSSYILEKHKVA